MMKTILLPIGGIVAGLTCGVSLVVWAANGCVGLKHQSSRPATGGLCVWASRDLVRVYDRQGRILASQVFVVPHYKPGGHGNMVGVYGSRGGVWLTDQGDFSRHLFRAPVRETDPIQFESVDVAVGGGHSTIIETYGFMWGGGGSAPGGTWRLVISPAV